jgi:hypothetical protein
MNACSPYPKPDAPYGGKILALHGLEILSI